ncbi:putative phage transcription regulator [Thioalkalivibrio sulfidiphilus HL-EbGr7]|uniref:Putative phage transcription regulator n=1 Tax=Thioalkalivibrio sulfidiphilus (strain HL-EbGR7) TaxID=396588 RepID=B8GS29_THISH|nr:Mor transcription activator family protein [Thioalkalivibrio sulfidiphilus]ACL72733.1 putative phage transcription regulator [Thioalkalivibrio sulfidiphilus HL-EbGr7]
MSDSRHDAQADMGFEVPADALEQLQDPEITKKWPQALTDMLMVIEGAYRRGGDDEQTARARAFVAVRALAHYHGGHIFYLPKGQQIDRALRDREIWERHDGANVAELAREFELNEVRIYKILAEQRKLARARRQPDLFERRD